MIVSELIKYLSEMKDKHGDVIVVTQRCSDFGELTIESDITIVKCFKGAVNNPWWTRYYENQWDKIPEEDKPNLVTAIYFIGN